jgi:pimeloyl-ACP methyl ester carboxylesterase
MPYHRCGFIHSSIAADQIAHDLFGVMDKVGIRAFHIFGVALGSLLGIRMAALYPVRVLTLTLCTTLFPTEVRYWRSRPFNTYSDLDTRQY